MAEGRKYILRPEATTAWWGQRPQLLKSKRYNISGTRPPQFIMAKGQDLYEVSVLVTLCIGRVKECVQYCIGARNTNPHWPKGCNTWKCLSFLYITPLAFQRIICLKKCLFTVWQFCTYISNLTKYYSYGIQYRLSKKSKAFCKLGIFLHTIFSKKKYSWHSKEHDLKMSTIDPKKFC